jgi:hypothetical protein
MCAASAPVPTNRDFLLWSSSCREEKLSNMGRAAGGVEADASPGISAGADSGIVPRRVVASSTFCGCGLVLISASRSP